MRFFFFEKTKNGLKKVLRKWKGVVEHRGHYGVGPVWKASHLGYRCQEYDNCPKKQEPVVRLSRQHPTEHACFLQDMLQDYRGTRF